AQSDRRAVHRRPAAGGGRIRHVGDAPAARRRRGDQQRRDDGARPWAGRRRAVLDEVPRVVHPRALRVPQRRRERPRRAARVDHDRHHRRRRRHGLRRRERVRSRRRRAHHPLPRVLQPQRPRRPPPRGASHRL
ncbi:MAG: hypothetical protein AVDCRST_MAG11-3202, partial [uncultured Gemmatimonadaceae bacterium]